MRIRKVWVVYQVWRSRLTIYGFLFDNNNNNNFFALPTINWWWLMIHCPDKTSSSKLFRQNCSAVDDLGGMGLEPIFFWLFMLMMTLDFLPNTTGHNLRFHFHYVTDIFSLLDATLVSGRQPSPSPSHFAMSSYKLPRISQGTILASGRLTYMPRLTT